MFRNKYLSLDDALNYEDIFLFLSNRVKSLFFFAFAQDVIKQNFRGFHTLDQNIHLKIMSKIYHESLFLARQQKTLNTTSKLF